jgi:hypothetical protein
MVRFCVVWDDRPGKLRSTCRHGLLAGPGPRSGRAAFGGRRQRRGRAPLRQKWLTVPITAEARSGPQAKPYPL